MKDSNTDVAEQGVGKGEASLFKYKKSCQMEVKISGASSLLYAVFSLDTRI